MSREKIPGLLADFQGLRFKGQYRSDELYKQNDVVLYESRFWVYIFETSNSNVAPAFPSNFWKDLGGECTVKSGLLSSRPLASVDNRGRFYYATDSFEQRLYFSTGADWQLAGVPVVANTTRPGLVRVNTNDVDPVVYRKQELDTAITTNNLTVIASSSVPTQAVTNSSAQIANTQYVNNFWTTQNLLLTNEVGGKLSLLTGNLSFESATSTTLFYTPCNPSNPHQALASGRITLFVNGDWRLVSFSEVSLSTTALTPGGVFDVFVSWNSGANNITLTTQQWSNTSARIALQFANGVCVRSAANPTERYVGTIRVTTGGSMTIDERTVVVYNHYNRIERPLRMMPSITTEHTYDTAAWRIYSNSFNIRLLIPFLSSEGLMLPVTLTMHPGGVYKGNGATAAPFSINYGIGRIDIASASLILLASDGYTTPTISAFLKLPAIHLNQTSHNRGIADYYAAQYGDGGAGSIRWVPSSNLSMLVGSVNLF